MGGVTTNQQLLTDEARRAHLHALFGHRFTMQGKLQLPELADYNGLETSAGLKDLGIEICRWIGLKPSGLDIQFSETALSQGYKTDLKSKQIRVNGAYKRHPYSCAALLTLAIISYAIEKAQHSAPNRELVELASIELGTGLWILNALEPKTRYHHKLYHLLDSSWHEREIISLQSFSSTQYVEAVVQYAHENRVPADEYIPHIPKRNQKLLPAFTASQSNRHLPESRMTVQHKKNARIFLIKIIVASLVIASAISVAIYAASIRATGNNPRAEQQLQVIDRLRKQHTDCLADASRQQSTYDPNDLFLTRQIDATKARCESLRNQYNYAIDQYNLIP